VDAEALKVFLAREGFECQHLQLAYFGKHKLRGMMATEHISPGDTLLAFPALASTFNLASSRTCPCPELVASDFWEESESWTLKMALWLVAEEIKGSASRFAGKISQKSVYIDFMWSKILESKSKNTIHRVHPNAAACEWECAYVAAFTARAVAIRAAPNTGPHDTRSPTHTLSP
jgi:hypothetical protein